MRAPRQPIDLAHGLVVRLPAACRCGSEVATIAAGAGPHAAALRCLRCERHCRWLSHQEHQFIAEIVAKFGRPIAPIAIRRGGGTRIDRTRPTYAVTFRAVTGDDSIHSLRATLKYAARRGLRAISARQVQDTLMKLPAAAGADGEKQAKRAVRRSEMDMSEFAGSRFLKVQDVKSGPIRARIVRVDLGKYNKPNIHLDDGNILSGNATNVRVLCRAYGSDSDGWIDKEIDLTLGTIEYQGEDQEAIVVNPISPPEPKSEGQVKAAKPMKAKSKSSDMDDTIPF